MAAQDKPGLTAIAATPFHRRPQACCGEKGEKNATRNTDALCQFNDHPHDHPSWTAHLGKEHEVAGKQLV